MARRPSKRSPEASREEILSAARDCFTECGYHEARVDEIAERAGLSKGAVYWHFAGKRELFHALLDHEFQRLVALIAAAESAPSAEAAIHRMSEASLGEMPRTFPVFELTLEYLAQASRDPELRERLEAMYALGIGSIANMVRRGIEEGAFADVKPEEAASAIGAALDGLLLQKVVRPDLDLPAMWRATEQLLLRGLLKR